MYPILFKLGPFNLFGITLGPIFIYTYGLMVALGFLGAIISSVKLAKRENIEEETVMDICLWILIFSIAGARILYILLNFSYYIEKPLEIFQVYKGGLVFYGGFVAGILTCIWYTYKHKLAIWKIGDILAPGIAFGQSLGRIGCFFRGCCFGEETTLPWGITFPDDSLASYLYGSHHHIHPTQIYEALINISIFIFLWFYTKRKKFDGQIFCLYAILYAFGRFLVEGLRGDIERGFISFLSTSQVFALVFFISGMGIYIYLSRQKKLVRII